MTPEQFAYWLQGHVELGNGSVPSFEQWKSIREHLATVFVKVTPAKGEPPKAVESDVQRQMREYFERTKQQQYPSTGVVTINPSLVTC